MNEGANMERDSFIFYRSFHEAIKCLSDEEAVKCFRAITTYALDGEEIEIDGAAKAIFITVKPQIDANNRKYLNGLKGGKPKQNQNVTKTEPKRNQEETKAEPNVNVNDNDNVNDINNNIVKIDYQNIINLYNTICVSLPKVTKISDSRKRAIKARLKSYTEEDLKKAFELAEESDFLSGRNGTWNASFDWLMNDTNLAKVLDGNYKNNRNDKPKMEMDSNLRQFIDSNQVIDFGIG